MVRMGRSCARCAADVTIVETGEEGEMNVFAAHAKLYHLMRGDNPADHGWKERGAGLLKVNMTDPAMQAKDTEEGQGEAEKTAKRSARLLMRASGVYRVILNVPIYKGMKLLSPEGHVPTSSKSSKSLMLTIVEDGKPVMMQLKVCCAASLTSSRLTLHSFEIPPAHWTCTNA